MDYVFVVPPEAEFVFSRVAFIFQHAIIPLRIVHTSTASHGELQIFVADNNGAEQSCLSSLRFFGSPVATTKMGDFKKVEE